MNSIRDEIMEIFPEANISDPTEINELLEENGKIKIICGEIIGSGMFTAAIKLDWVFTPEEVKKRFENPVLIITIEKEKKEILQTVLGEEFVYTPDTEKEEKELEEEWLEYTMYDTREEAEENGEEFYIWEWCGDFNMLQFYKIFEERGIDFFYTEEMSQTLPSVEETVSMSVAIEFVSSCLPSMGFIETYGFKVRRIRPTIDTVKSFVEKEFQDTDDINIKKICKWIGIIKRDIMKMVDNVLINSCNKVYLDLHQYQVLKFKNREVLVDAFVL